MCLCLSTHRHPCAMACVWKSEGKLLESVLFSFSTTDIWGQKLGLLQQVLFPENSRSPRMSKEQAQTSQLESETVRVRVPTQLMPLSRTSHRPLPRWPLLYEWYLMRSYGKTASQLQNKKHRYRVLQSLPMNYVCLLTKIYHLAFLHIPNHNSEL